MRCRHCHRPIMPCPISDCDHASPWNLCKGYRHSTRTGATFPLVCIASESPTDAESFTVAEPEPAHVERALPVMLVDADHSREVDGCTAPAALVQEAVNIGGQFRDVYHCGACGITYDVSAQ